MGPYFLYYIFYLHIVGMFLYFAFTVMSYINIFIYFTSSHIYIICIVLYCVVLYCVVLCCIVLCCVVLVKKK